MAREVAWFTNSVTKPGGKALLVSDLIASDRVVALVCGAGPVAGIVGGMGDRLLTCQLPNTISGAASQGGQGGEGEAAAGGNGIKEPWLRPGHGQDSQWAKPGQVK